MINRLALYANNAFQKEPRVMTEFKIEKNDIKSQKKKLTISLSSFVISSIPNLDRRHQLTAFREFTFDLRSGLQHLGVNYKIFGSKMCHEMRLQGQQAGCRVKQKLPGRSNI